MSPLHIRRVVTPDKTILVLLNDEWKRMLQIMAADLNSEYGIKYITYEDLVAKFLEHGAILGDEAICLVITFNRNEDVLAFKMRYS